MAGARAVVLGLFALLPACADDGETAPAAAEKPGRFHDLVAKNRDAPLDRRVAVYLPLAETLSTAGKWPATEAHLSELVRELLLVRDLAVLDALANGLGGEDQRVVLFETVSREDDDPEVRELLGKWARKSPEEVVLAIYRPGGIDFLFDLLGNPEVKPQTRARCAFELARTGDRSLIPRLREHADDPTRVSLGSLRAGSGVPTLGEIVRKCIGTLEK